TFRPREWWHFEIDGLRHPVMGTNALVFKPEIFRRERLSFRQRPASDPTIRNGVDGRYDTGDHANEVLLRRGYAVVIPDAALRDVTAAWRPSLRSAAEALLEGCRALTERLAAAH